MKRVYIAGPYSADEPLVTGDNVRKAIDAGEQVVKMNALPFVPHLYHLWQVHTPHAWAYWMAMDKAWLEQCDALWRLPGKSVGADMEVEFAVERGIPVFLTSADLRAWVESDGQSS